MHGFLSRLLYTDSHLLVTLPIIVFFSTHFHTGFPFCCVCCSVTNSKVMGRKKSNGMFDR